MKNSVDLGGCYPLRLKARVDNTNNCFIIHSKYVPVLKGVSPFRSLFFRSPKITQSGPQVFLVNGSIIFSGLHF